jgi:hypothetical protein
MQWLEIPSSIQRRCICAIDKTGLALSHPANAMRADASLAVGEHTNGRSDGVDWLGRHDGVQRVGHLKNCLITSAERPSYFTISDEVLKYDLTFS